MQDELQEELAQELVSYNIDPMVEGLTDEQYTQAMAELGQRREALLGGKAPEEQRRIHAMRNNILWHLHTVSLVCQALCPPPPGLWGLPAGCQLSSPGQMLDGSPTLCLLLCCILSPGHAGSLSCRVLKLYHISVLLLPCTKYSCVRLYEFEECGERFLGWFQFVPMLNVQSLSFSKCLHVACQIVARHT